MAEAMEDGAGVAVQAAASPAEATSGEAPELTAEQVSSREAMLDRANAGPQRPGIVEGVSEPPFPGSASVVEGEPPSVSFQNAPTPTPCP